MKKLLSSKKTPFILGLLLTVGLSSCAPTGARKTLKQRTTGLYVQGTDLYKSGDYIQATYLLRQAIEFDSTFAEAYFVLGLTDHKLKKYAEAIANISKADTLETITEKPGYDEADIKFNLGLVYLDLEDYDNALENLKAAVKFRENYTKAYHNIGFIYDKLDQREEAYNYLNKAISTADSAASTLDTTYVALGVLYKKDANIDSAKAQFEKAIEFNEENKDAYNELGIIYREQKEFAAAIRHFRRATQIENKFADAFINLGLVYIDMESYEQAKAAFQKVTEIDSTLPEGYVNLAQAYYFLSDATASLHTFEKALTLDPKRKVVNFQMGQIYEKQGKTSDAIAAYKKEIALNSDHAQSHFNLAILLQKADKLQEAAAEFEKFVALVPEDDARSQKVRKILDQLKRLN